MFETLVEAAEGIARKVVSPRDLVLECLSRIDDYDEEIRAFTYVDREGALNQADRLGEEVAKEQPRSPLHGIPFAVKDIVNVAGLPTTASSRILKSNVAGEDAAMVAALRRAGAVILGKTNLDEFAYGVFSSPTANPWDRLRVPGGSSGGSAAALSAGMCLGALGTDTAGSIRIPSALCGVVGLKPRRDGVDMSGVFPLAPSLDVCGPMVRAPRDLLPIWNSITGSRPGDGASRIRAGIADLECLDLDANVIPLYEGLSSSLGEAARVETIVIPDLVLWERSRGHVLMAEALEIHKARGYYPERAREYSPTVRASFEYAEQITEDQLAAARTDLYGLCTRLLDLLNERDVLVLPTTPCVAPLKEEVFTDSASRRAWLRRLTSYAAPINCCPLAAASIPAGVTSEGLPWGVDVVGSNESSVLDFISRAAPAYSMAPPLEPS